MVNRHSRFVRQVRAITAAALVLLLVVTSASACATLGQWSSVRTTPADVQPARYPPPFDWARVEAVRDGTLLKVQLHEVDARQGSQMIEGRFHAATADSLTLTLDDGQTRTLAKSAIHTVRGPRPIGKRYAGWIPLVGVMTYFSVLGLYPDIVATKALLFGFTLGLPASLPGFLLQRTQRIYEGSPEQLITQVDVSLTDDAVVSRSQGTTVTVAHASRVGRPLDEPIGLTVCLSSQPTRCTGGWAVFEGPAGRLSNPVTATLGFGDETVPVDTPMPIYVHVVLRTGPSWSPSPDRALPQLGDPRVLDVETVTRRITVVDR